MASAQQKRLAIIAFITFTIISLIFVWYNYPLLNQDSSCFLVPSYFINHGGQLINPIYDANIDKVTHKFLYYPPLYPCVIAAILKVLPNTLNSWYLAITLLSELGMALTVYTSYIWFKRKQTDIKKLAPLFIVFWVLSLFAYQDITAGRPEVLCKLFLIFFILNNVIQNKNQYFINGLLIGLNGLTSPISTFYLIVIAGFELAYRNNFKLKPIFQTIIGGGVVLLLFVWLYPYSVVLMFNKILVHAHNCRFYIVGREYWTILFTRHFISPELPLAAVPYIIAFFYLLGKLYAKKKYLAMAFLLVLTFLIYEFCIEQAMTTYNLYVLSPFVSFLLPIIYLDVVNPGKKSTTLTTKLYGLGISALLAINCIGFIRTTLILGLVRQDMVTAADFRNTFLRQIAQTKPGKKILISTSLWPYCLDHTNQVLQIRTFDPRDTTLSNPAIQFIMFQQNYTGMSKPMEIPNFKLIENQFIKKSKKIGPVALFNTYPGYQVAIYERN